MADPATFEPDGDAEGRFIERVLLALDGHLDEEGLEALKAELAGDVERRRLFVQLCLQSRALSEVLNLHRQGVGADDRAFLEAIELRLGPGRAAGEAAGRATRGAAPRPPRHQWLPWTIAAAASVVAAISTAFALGRRPAAAPAPAQPPVAAAPVRKEPEADERRAVSAADAVAMLIKLDGVQWERADEPHPREGDLLPPGGRLRLRSGRATLTMLSGVVVIAEGPADVDLIAVDRVFCRRGKLRTRVPKGAEGFVVASQSSSVLDLGTEFGLNLEPSGKSLVTVFDGKAEALVRTETEEGEQVRDQIIERSKVYEIDPTAGMIEAVEESKGFIAPNDLAPPPLVLDPSYPDAVLEARPWGYWRFEAMRGREVPNEIPGRPPLLATGPVRVDGPPDDNRSAVFKAGDKPQYLALEGFWEPTSRLEYAVELWFMPEVIDHSALATMASPKDTNNHVFFLEMTSRNRHATYPPASIRFLDRWPPGTSGGCNIFSKSPYVPYRWHHLVGQMNKGRMELFLDGEATFSLPIHLGDSTVPRQFLLGRLSTVPKNDYIYSRAFVGRLDEVALYDHPLAIDEIRRHHRSATQGPRAPAPAESVWDERTAADQAPIRAGPAPSPRAGTR
jgi:hypothetical protein